MTKLFLSVPKISSISLGGGGARGCVYGPVLKALENNRILGEIEDVLGVSAGAITASLLAIGMSLDEITQMTQETNFKSLLGSFSLFKGHQFGIYYTQELQKMADTKLLQQFKNRISELDALYSESLLESKDIDKKEIDNLRDKTNVTFESLEKIRILFTKVGQPHKIKTLTILAAKAENGSPVLFSNNVNATVNIADAVAASSAIPPVFKPHQITIDGEPMAFIDGGMHCSLLTPEYNVPRFATLMEKRLSSILLLLYPEEEANKIIFKRTKQPNIFMVVIGYLLKFVFGANGVMAKFGMEQGAKVYGQNVIPMNVGISPNDFDVSLDKKKLLGQQAAASVENYLNNYKTNAEYCIEGLSIAHCLYQTPASQLDEAETKLKLQTGSAADEQELIGQVLAHRRNQQNELEARILLKITEFKIDEIETLFEQYCNPITLIMSVNERNAIVEINTERLYNGIQNHLAHFFKEHSQISDNAMPYLSKMKEYFEQQMEENVSPKQFIV